MSDVWRCRSVQVILGYIDLARPVFHPGERHRLYVRFPFEPHPHCTFGESEKDICVKCGRLQANIVSRSPAFLYSLRAPPHQIFWGPSLQVSWRTPNPHRCAVLDKPGVLPPAVQVVSCRSSDRRCGHCMHRVLVKWRAEQEVRRII